MPVRLDWVSGKPMICLVCLFQVAAGSMSVTCRSLWTRESGVKYYLYV